MYIVTISTQANRKKPFHINHSTRWIFIVALSWSDKDREGAPRAATKPATKDRCILVTIDYMEYFNSYHATYTPYLSVFNECLDRMDIIAGLLDIHDLNIWGIYACIAACSLVWSATQYWTGNQHKVLPVVPRKAAPVNQSGKRSAPPHWSIRQLQCRKGNKTVHRRWTYCTNNMNCIAKLVIFSVTRRLGNIAHWQISALYKQ